MILYLYIRFRGIHDPFRKDGGGHGQVGQQDLPREAGDRREGVPAHPEPRGAPHPRREQGVRQEGMGDRRTER